KGSIERAAAPADFEVASHIERAQDPSDSEERERVQMATLDGRDRGLRNIRRRGEVGLTPAAASAQGPNDQSDSSVVHFDMLAPVPYPRPIAGLRGCSTVRRLMRDTVRRSRPADDWSPTRSATPQEDLIRGQGDDAPAWRE